MAVTRQRQNEAAQRMEDAEMAPEPAPAAPVRGMNGTTSRVTGKPPQGSPAQRPRRGARKGSVTDLLAIFGAPGLNSQIEMAGSASE